MNSREQGSQLHHSSEGEFLYIPRFFCNFQGGVLHLLCLSWMYQLMEINYAKTIPNLPLNNTLLP